MSRWNWTMDAGEARRLLFGSNYKKPDGFCDHLPEVFQHTTSEYRCNCGKVSSSKLLMESCNSKHEFIELLGLSIRNALQEEGVRWCRVCAMFHEFGKICPDPETQQHRSLPVTPSQNQLLMQLYSKIQSGELSLAKAAQVFRLSMADLNAEFVKNGLQPITTTIPAMQSMNTPVVSNSHGIVMPAKFNVIEEKEAELPVALPRGYRKIDLDE